MQKQRNRIDQLKYLSLKGQPNEQISQGPSWLLSSKVSRNQRWVNEEEETIGRYGQTNRR